ncbi:MAG: hypothetical protein ACC628_03530 [Pirellulaceae bacterium]
MERSEPRPLEQLVPIRDVSPLLWSMPAAVRGGDTETRIQWLHRLSLGTPSANGQWVRDLELWLEQTQPPAADAQIGLDCLAWCHALPNLIQVLPAAPWCQLLGQLVEMARQAPEMSLVEEPLGQQILAGELPWTLAYLFPELAECERLAEDASSQLSHGILELLDGEGMLEGRNLHLAHPLLACWTRCGYLGRSMGRRALDAKATDQYAWFVRQSLRLARHDSSAVLSPDGGGPWPSPLIEAALDLADDRESQVLAGHLIPGRNGKEILERRKAPPLSIHSEWAEAAILRCDWSSESPQMAVTYGQNALNCEVNSGGQTLWSGRWDPVVSVNGQTLRSADTWDEVCWVTDSDGDYLELQINFDGNRVLQRQMFLARDDRFLFVADAVLGSEEAEIGYEAELPLRSDVCFQPEKETREGYLRGKRRLGRVLPLSLPEWRAQPSAGELAPTETGLKLHLSQVGKRLFAAWFIDLDPTRIKYQLTWRQLTVAEQLVTQADDAAVGYRVQIGHSQWLIYRSLAPQGNRTVLGQNFSTEFVLGRFTREGEVEKLIEIE